MLREWKTRNLAEELSRQKVQMHKGPELVAFLAYSCNTESQWVWRGGREEGGYRKEGHLEMPTHCKEVACSVRDGCYWQTLGERV